MSFPPSSSNLAEIAAAGDLAACSIPWAKVCFVFERASTRSFSALGSLCSSSAAKPDRPRPTVKTRQTKHRDITFHSIVAPFQWIAVYPGLVAKATKGVFIEPPAGLETEF